MKRVICLVCMLALLLSACAPTQKRCGDGNCDGPETIANCPNDCDALPNSLPNNAAPPDVTNGTDGLAKSMDITVTTSTADQGYGITVSGVMHFDLSFPSAGGEASLPMGSLTITGYEWEEIPGCEVVIPDGLVGASQAIQFDEIVYTPGGFMVLQSPIVYDNRQYDIKLECKVTGSVTLNDQPFYKLVGVFNDKFTTLSFKPEDGFDNSTGWNRNDVFSSRIVIDVK